MVFYNKIGDKGAMCLRDALKSNETLTILGLAGNTIDKSILNEITEYLED